MLLHLSTTLDRLPCTTCGGSRGMRVYFSRTRNSSSLQVSPGKPTRNLDIKVVPLVLPLSPYCDCSISVFCVPFVGRPVLLQMASVHRNCTAHVSDRIRHSWGIACGIPRATHLRRCARLVRYKWAAQGGRVSVLVGLPRALTCESVLGHLTWTPTTCETHAAWGVAPPPHLTETLPLA